jgi:penicillin-binding protein 2
MRHAIAVSSDEYFYQIGGGYKDQKGLGILRIGEYARRFGFGSKTEIDFPKELSGTIPSPEWKKENFKGEDWLLGNTYHTVIGQYGFQVTPLELVRAVASIANGGKLITPRIYGTSSEFTNLNLNADFLNVVHEGMRLSVEEGVAKALDVNYLEIAAKTGTAETGVHKEYINSLVEGFFPYDNPKYAFVIIMEKAPKGTLFGAPAVMRNILDSMHNYSDEYFK